MQLRHILEYEDHEIQDLMGDLDSVGQMKSLQGTLWARFTTYKIKENYWSYRPETLCFLRTEPFFGLGDGDRDEAIALQQIQKGAFTRVEDPDARSLTTLQKGNPAAMQVLESSNIKTLAQTCSSMDELIGKIRQALMQAQKAELIRTKELHSYNIKDASTVLVYGFIAPVGSPYLETFDMDKPFVKGGGINHQG